MICRYCAVNEILVRNSTSCEKCPKFYWPEQNSALTCESIPETYFKVSSSTFVIVSLISVIG